MGLWGKLVSMEQTCRERCSSVRLMTPEGFVGGNNSRFCKESTFSFFVCASQIIDKGIFNLNFKGIRAIFTKWWIKPQFLKNI